MTFGISLDPAINRPRARPQRARRAMALWLLAVAILVAAMVLLGGATRLTHSGLSMVEWRPVTGLLPPLSEDVWQAAFAKYRAFPEYQKVNRGMTLAEYKSIFWFEYAHRLLGRLIGLAFLLPFLWFLARRNVDRRLAVRFAGLFVLGGLQGLIGWWMVRSGLVDRPDVSHYRLAVHLGLALAIFAALVWTAADLWPRAGERGTPAASAVSAPRSVAAVALVLVFLQAVTGAFTAGLDAGFAYNTFPTMNGVWLPPELWALNPWWLNLVENTTTVQFVHRFGAVIVTLAVLSLWWRVHRGGVGRTGRLLAHLSLAALAVQVLLGVLTLVYVVPALLAVLHQAGALGLLAALTLATHRLWRVDG